MDASAKTGVKFCDEWSVFGFARKIPPKPKEGLDGAPGSVLDIDIPPFLPT
jgi:hypothetical protein